MRPWRVLVPLVLLGLPAAAGRPVSGAEPFVVIVNAANPVAVLPAAQVSQMFLHKIYTWPDGSRVTPVDLPEDAPARGSFSPTVHGRSVAAIKAYWQRLIFSGRDVPPAEKSNAEVVSFVRSEAGAIGYVAAGTPLGEGVKLLKITR